MNYLLFRTNYLDTNLRDVQGLRADYVSFNALLFAENWKDLYESNTHSVLLIDCVQLKPTMTFPKNLILLICDSDEQLELDKVKTQLPNNTYLIFRQRFHKMLVYLNTCMNLQKSIYKEYEHQRQTNHVTEALLNTLKNFIKTDAFIINKHSKKIVASTNLEKDIEISTRNIYQNDYTALFQIQLTLFEDYILYLDSPLEKFNERDEFVALFIRYRLLTIFYNKGNTYESFKYYSSLLNQALDNRINTPSFYEELKYIDLKNNNQKPYFFWVSISFNEKTAGTDEYGFYLKLLEIFGKQFIGKASNIFHVLFRTTDPLRRFPEELYATLNDFCQKYHSYAIISGNGFQYERIKTMLLMNLPIFSIGVRFREKSTQRIFFFHDYTIYFLIDFFAKSYKHYYSETNLRYLIHQSIYNLYLFDKSHDTNLTKILYTYLMNKQNIKITAEKLFMHRNTVMKKLKQIEEITDENLDDVDFQYKAIFSYLIIQYYEKKENEKFHVRDLPE